MFKTKESTAIILSLVISGVGLAALEIADRQLDGRHVWKSCQSHISENVRFCESERADLTKFMVEPINSRSNYAYVIYGMYLVVFGAMRWREVWMIRRRAAVAIAATDAALFRSDDDVESSVRSGVMNADDGIGNDDGTDPATATGERSRSDDEDGRHGDIESCKCKDNCNCNCKFNEIDHQSSNVATNGHPDDRDSIIDSTDDKNPHDGARSEQCKLPQLQTAAPMDANIATNTLKNLERLNMILQYPMLMIAFGSTMILLGFGSWWFHASQCAIANDWDAIGMFTNSVFPMIYCIVSLCTASSSSPQREHELRQYWVYAVPFVMALFILFEFTIDLHNALWMALLVGFSGAAIAVMTLLRRKTHTYNYWMAAGCIVMFAVSYTIWSLDVDAIICRGRIGGHAYWHIGTCIAIAFAIRYLQSERLIVAPESNDTRTATKTSRPSAMKPRTTSITAGLASSDLADMSWSESIQLDNGNKCNNNDEHNECIKEIGSESSGCDEDEEFSA